MDEPPKKKSKAEKRVWKSDLIGEEDNLQIWASEMIGNSLWEYDCIKKVPRTKTSPLKPVFIPVKLPQHINPPTDPYRCHQKRS